MQKKRTTIADMQECLAKVADLTEKNLKLLAALDEKLTVVALNEARFQIAVAGKLSRIEAITQVLGISELIETSKNYPKCELTIYEKLERYEQLIHEESREIEGRMLNLMQGVTSTRRNQSKVKKPPVGS